MGELSRDRLFAYGVAVLATGTSLLIRLPLVRWLGYHAEVMTFFPAIILSAYLGGLRPGLLATLLGAVAGDFFFLEPRYTLAIHDLGTAFGLGLFVLTGVAISGVMEMLHRSRRRIAASERRYAVTLASIGDAVIATDTHGRVSFMNPAAERLTAWLQADASERLLTDVFRIVNEQTGQPVEDPAAKVLRLGTVVGVANHTALLARDGRELPIDDSAAPIIDDHGAVAGVVLVFRDVTERRRAEESEAFRQSEQRWRSLTEALPQLVWSALPDGAWDYFSTQWTEHTGVAEAELLGWRWLETLHPEDQQRTRQFWLESVAGQHPYDVEYRVRRQDGENRWFKTRGTPIRDSGGNIVKWFGTCTDITDLRQAEQALRSSEQRFRGTFENAAVGIAHTHPTGRFLRVNERFCAIMGYQREDLLQMSFQDITHPDDLPASRDSLAALLQGESPSFGLEKRYLHKDGEVIWVEMFVSLQRDLAGKPDYAIAVVQDISERKRLDAEVRQAKEAAETANQAKDEFLANVSHEIRTPMNAILGMTDLVLDTPLAENQRQNLKTVKSAAENLLVIINDLLDFAKIEAGKLELDVGNFSLRSVFGDTLQALTGRAGMKRLELSHEVHPEVPDALVGDAGRVRQVLLNLVDNAIKFTEKGEVVVQVRMVMDPIGRTSPVGPSLNPSVVSLCFKVIDTGIGISEGKQEKIFQAFEQEDASTTRKYGGTGLGLTIAARLVALMGGRITVDSEPGRGSTFTFTAQFALQPTHSALDSKSSPAADALTERSAKCGTTPQLRILVAEDNVFNGQLLEQLLEKRGYIVQLAIDGREALRLAADNAFDVMLLDIHMPEMDGFQVALAIRERETINGGHLPIIALTARSRTEDRRQCLAAGMDEFLAKPIQAADLWAAIDRVRTTSTLPASVNSPPMTATGAKNSHLLAPNVLMAACGGEDTILQKICQTFVARLPDHLNAIHDAFDEQDAGRLRETAHKLAGMVGAFSSVAGATASNLEDLAAQSQLEESGSLIAQLDTMCEELLRLVRGLSISDLRYLAASAAEPRSSARP
jgi:PAS domain S-box-containing protein